MVMSGRSVFLFIVKVFVFTPLALDSFRSVMATGFQSARYWRRVLRDVYCELSRLKGHKSLNCRNYFFVVFFRDLI